MVLKLISLTFLLSTISALSIIPNIGSISLLNSLETSLPTDFCRHTLSHYNPSLVALIFNLTSGECNSCFKVTNNNGKSMYVRAIGKAESGIKVSEEVFEKLVDGNESKFQVKWEKANDKKCNMMDKIGDGRKYKNRGMRERAKNEVDNDGNDVIVVHIQSKSLVKIKYMGIDDSESAGKDKDDKAMKLGLRNSKPEEGDNENNLIYQELPKISGIRNTRIDIKFIFDE